MNEETEPKAETIKAGSDSNDGLGAWAALQKRFMALSKKTGRNKMSSFALDVHFAPDGEVSVHLGTYDIGDWNRHTELGPFKNERFAFEATEQKIEEAEWVVTLDDDA